MTGILVRAAMGNKINIVSAENVGSGYKSNAGNGPWQPTPLAIAVFRVLKLYEQVSGLAIRVRELIVLNQESRS